MILLPKSPISPLSRIVKRYYWGSCKSRIHPCAVNSSSTKTLTKLKDNFCQNSGLYFTPVRFRFYEETRTGAPDPISAYELDEHLKRGFPMLLDEFRKLGGEIKETLLQDHPIFEHGDTDVIFRFDTEDALKKWNLGSDKMNRAGNSECSLVMNNQGKAVFSGVIDNTPPKDGKLHFSGYCSMISKKLTKSFYRQNHFDWIPFTHLEMRVRGDGRSYLILLKMGHYFDLTWFDVYNYGLYTHGGPYWQTIRIPFSKFYLSSKGRIQDKQNAMPKNKVDSVGITATNVAGPFKLEIDYIGVHRDVTEKEKFAYELYNIPEYIVST